MKLFSILLFSSTFMLVIAGCGEENNIPAVDNQACISSGEIMLQAFGRKGLAYYNAHQKIFTIQTAIEGTYDSVDIGIVCNMPVGAQEEIKAASASQKLVNVVFSGTYRQLSDPDFGKPLPGYAYYALILSSFKIENTPAPQ